MNKNINDILISNILWAIASDYACPIPGCDD